MATVDQHFVLHEFLAEGVMAEHHEFSYGKEYQSTYDPAEAKGYTGHDGDVDYFFGCLVFFQTDEIQQPVDMDEQPSGHLV